VGHAEHKAALLGPEHVFAHVEWQNANATQPVPPSSLYPSGQSFTHLFPSGCVKYEPVSGQLFVTQWVGHF
jgi:hypothetical protein